MIVREVLRGVYDFSEGINQMSIFPDHSCNNFFIIPKNIQCMIIQKTLIRNGLFFNFQSNNVVIV